MARKKILSGSELVEKISKGVFTIGETVASTLGPKGSNVILDKGYGSPLITNDGVTIAREIELSDPYENMGVKLLYECANNTNDESGDGTSTAIVLASNIYKEASKLIYEKGFSPVLVRKGIEEASSYFSRKLLKLSRKVKDDDDIEAVASISSSSKEIGSIIKEGFKQVSKDGVLLVSDSRGFETSLEIVKGVRFDKGYISPYFVSNSSDKPYIEMEKPLILISDMKISNLNDIYPLLEKVANSGRPLLIICDDVDSNILQALILNKLRGGLNVVIVRPPYFGDRRKDFLNDLGVVLDGKFISSDISTSFKDVEISDLGKASKVKITKDNTTIIGGEGRKEDVQSLIEKIKEELKVTETEYQKVNLTKRIGMLSQGVGIIKVGAITETELNEKKLRIEDAINATKAAMEEGILPGGGIALFKLSPCSINETEEEVFSFIDRNFTFDKSSKENDRVIKEGFICVCKAMLSPFYTIIENSCPHMKNEVISNPLLFKNRNYGFDANSLKFVDMYKAGIIDPTKVTRSALINACSVVSMLISSKVAIAMIPEELSKSSKDLDED